ncbi:MAG: DNA recombination protein RmuC [Burkholderiales bacterium]|nr:DNA recombination protein RmuC [Burkholderiales bacterium]
MNSEILVITAVIIVILLSVAFIIIKKLSTINTSQQLAIANKELELSLTRLNSDLEYTNKENYKLKSDINILEQSNTRKESQLSEAFINEKNALFEKASLLEENKHLKDAYGKLESTLGQLRKQISEDFEQLKNIAIHELEKKANESLKEISKDNVVTPLQDKFKELQLNIDALKIETKLINHNSENLNQQANNLATALTRDSKKRGDFGEIILANILESVGLSEHISYIEQEQLKLNDKKIIPDVIINLPHDRAVIVDSKNIMKLYYDSIEQQQDKTKAIISAIRTTFKDLSSKNYAESLADITGKNVFAYVIMFIPNGAVFDIVVEENNRLQGNLFKEAYQNNIFIAGPSTLLLLLSMIEKAWETYLVEERAESILVLASEISDKIRLTIERIALLGSSINKASTQYNEVIKSLDNGTNSSLINKLEKITQLSLAKELPNELVEVSADVRYPSSIIEKL